MRISRQFFWVQLQLFSFIGLADMKGQSKTTKGTKTKGEQSCQIHPQYLHKLSKSMLSPSTKYWPALDLGNKKK